MSFIPIQVKLRVENNSDKKIPLRVETSACVFTIKSSSAINISEVTPAYEGSYVFTPSDETQTVAIEGKRAVENIVINPIPSNWGRIGWNGSYLTVS